MPYDPHKPIDEQEDTIWRYAPWVGILLAIIAVLILVVGV